MKVLFNFMSEIPDLQGSSTKILFSGPKKCLLFHEQNFGL